MIMIAAVAAVAVTVAAVAGILAFNANGGSGPVNPAQDPLLTVADLGTLGGVKWAEPASSGDGLRPVCLPAAADGMPPVQRIATRRIGSSDSAVDALVQVVDTYASPDLADQAYRVRLGQLGTCPRTVALITGANEVVGLADAADAVRVVVQDAKNQFHTVLIAQTGRNISQFDLLTTSREVPVTDLAATAARALSRQCSNGEQGTCPGAIEVTSSVPAAANHPGWLVEADLPRINPGTGRWGATEPATTLSVVGSQCEAMNMQTIAGVTSAAQRTFLLADDPAAPTGFGVDQVVYSLSGDKGAGDLAKKLGANIKGCPDRAPTAKVEDGPAVKGIGRDGLPFTGATFVVTQTTETTTIIFRVAVVAIGSRVCYLLANASTNFDFTDEQWQDIAVRAGQRVSQTP